MECHQGRASTVTVNNNIVEAGLDPVADLDTVSEDVGFTNIWNGFCCVPGVNSIRSSTVSVGVGSGVGGTSSSPSSPPQAANVKTSNIMSHRTVFRIRSPFRCGCICTWATDAALIQHTLQSDIVHLAFDYIRFIMVHNGSISRLGR